MATHIRLPLTLGKEVLNQRSPTMQPKTNWQKYCNLFGVPTKIALKFYCFYAYLFIEGIFIIVVVFLAGFCINLPVECVEVSRIQTILHSTESFTESLEMDDFPFS